MGPIDLIYRMDETKGRGAELGFIEDTAYELAVYDDDAFLFGMFTPKFVRNFGRRR